MTRKPRDGTELIRTPGVDTDLTSEPGVSTELASKPGDDTGRNQELTSKPEVGRVDK